MQGNLAEPARRTSKEEELFAYQFSELKVIPGADHGFYGKDADLNA